MGLLQLRIFHDSVHVVGPRPKNPWQCIQNHANVSVYKGLPENLCGLHWM